MQRMRAQGATEYLVLLAVVLIVALVSVALLGFFPGMASDAQITQSRAYWQSAQPISIVEIAAKIWTGNGVTYPYLRLRNVGAYPVRITGIVGADGGKITQFSASGCGLSGLVNISDLLYLAPGEENYIGWSVYGLACDREIGFISGTTATIYIGGASSVCQNSSTDPGMMLYNSFGFEYIEYVDGQQLTKREIGKKLIIKCDPRYP